MQSVSQTFGASQADTVLVSIGSSARVVVHGVVFAAHANNSVSPAMTLKIGGQTVIEHPGVPAGGGLVMSGFRLFRGQGDDLTFNCDAPTGGSVSVMVAYSIQ